MRRFYLHTRHGIYYAELIDPETGRKLSPRSTGATERDAALLTVAKWLEHGVPAGRTGKVRPAAAIFGLDEVLSAIRREDLTVDDAEKSLTVLKGRNLVVGNFAKAGPSSELFLAFLERIWDIERSPFLAEKKVYGHSATRRHALEQAGVVRRYWDRQEWATVRLIDVTRSDLKAHLLRLSGEGLAPATLNKALAAVSAPLAWAARSELIPMNPAEGIPRFSGASKKRDILTQAELRALVSLQWPDERARVAFLVALTTGARLGEIDALQLRDIGDDRLYIRHSWGFADGLKATKNREEREVPLLPAVRDALRALGMENPHGAGDERFVFYGVLADKPLDAKVLGNGFTEALHSIGIDEAARRARGLVFHSLRHCFATALADRIDQRQAMKATGHRTSVVFESYANHESENDLASIGKASEDAFGTVLAFAAKKGA